MLAIQFPLALVGEMNEWFSFDTPFGMSVCGHVSSVTPLNGFKEPKLKKFSDPTHMT